MDARRHELQAPTDDAPGIDVHNGNQPRPATRDVPIGIEYDHCVEHSVVDQANRQNLVGRQALSGTIPPGLRGRFPKFFREGVPVVCPVYIAAYRFLAGTFQLGQAELVALPVGDRDVDFNGREDVRLATTASGVKP